MSKKNEILDENIRNLETLNENSILEINGKNADIKNLQNNISELDSIYKKNLDFQLSKLVFIPKYSASIGWVLLAELIFFMQCFLKIGKETFISYCSLKNIAITAVFSLGLAFILALVIFLILKLSSKIIFKTVFKKNDIAVNEYRNKKESYKKKIKSLEGDIELCKKRIDGNLKAIEKKKNYIYSIELYEKAMLNVKFDNDGYCLNDPDEALLKKAADLGNKQACLYYGLICIENFSKSDEYTNSERQIFLAEAYKYMKIANMSGLEKAKLYWLCCRVMTETNNIDEWKNILEQLRALRKNNLCEREKTVYDLTISILVNHINEKDIGHYNQISYNVSSNSGIVNEKFDPAEYLESKNLLWYSQSGIDSIQNDNSLTPAQKEEALSHYRIHYD